MKTTFLIDIGGTNIEMKQIVGKKTTFLTFPATGLNKSALLKKIAGFLNKTPAKKLSIKVSSPTAVDLQTGFCKGYSGIKGYANFNLYEELGREITQKNHTIKALNDASCAMLGIINKEFKKPPQSAIMFALGTGIGGAIYLNKTIFNGAQNMAGEFGYPLWANTKSVSLALSPVNIFKKIDPAKTGEEILKSYANNPKTKVAINSWVEQLARFISFYAVGINPDYVFFSGGVTKSSLFQKLLQSQYLKTLKQIQLDQIIKTKVRFFNNKNINYSLEGANFI